MAVLCDKECVPALRERYPMPDREEGDEKKYKVEPEPDTYGKCGCACGGQPKGGRFLPGHDSTLKARRRNA